MERYKALRDKQKALLTDAQAINDERVRNAAEVFGPIMEEIRDSVGITRQQCQELVEESERLAEPYRQRAWKLLDEHDTIHRELDEIRAKYKVKSAHAARDSK